MDPQRRHAAQFLETLQRRVYQGLGITPTNYRSAEIRAFHEKFCRQAYDAWGGQHPGESFEDFRKMLMTEFDQSLDQTPTPYQDPNWYSLLINLTTEVEKVLQDRTLTLEHLPLFGTLPTGQVNAMAVAVPASQYYLVLFEDGLFGFANLASKVVARVFPLKEDEEKDGMIGFSAQDEHWRQELQAHPEIPQRFLDLIFAYVVGGNPHAAKPYLLDKTYQTFAGILRDAMEYFVVSHEYGHLVKGHLRGDNHHRSLLGGAATEVLSTSWQQEFEADAFGLDIMLAVMMKQGFDLSLSFWGADFFFGCIDLVERAVATLRSGRVEETLSPSHPPTLLRRQFLQQVLKNSVSPEHAEGPLGLSDIVYQILQDLWKISEPVLQRAHRDGVELAPAWRA